jgi:hypothetical protein
VYKRFEEDEIIKVINSRDSKIPPRLQLSSEWMPSRDAKGKLVPDGRLWDFIGRIALSRREGKNRRDGATVATRVLSMADMVSTQLFTEAQDGQAKGGAPTNITAEDAVTLKAERQRERRRRTAKL